MSKQVQKKEETSLTKEREAEIQRISEERLGFDALDQTDIILPRISVVQSLSQAFQNGLAKQGQLWNNALDEAFDELEVIPLFAFKSRLKLTVDKGLICRSDDAILCTQGEHGVGFDCASCPDSQWGQNSEKPKCSLAYNFVCIDVSRKIPCVITFMRSAITEAKKWVSKSQFTGKSMFSTKYKISSKKVTQENVSFHMPLVTMNGGCSVSELDFAIKAYETLKGKKIAVDIEETEAPNF